MKFSDNACGGFHTRIGLCKGAVGLINRGEKLVGKDTHGDDGRAAGTLRVSCAGEEYATFGISGSSTGNLGCKDSVDGQLECLGPASCHVI